MSNGEQGLQYKVSITALSMDFWRDVTCLTLQGIKYSLPQVPTGVAAASHQLQALAVPAAVVQIAAKLWRLRLIRQRRKRKPAKSTAASQGMLIRTSMDLSAWELDLSAKTCMLRHVFIHFLSRILLLPL